MRRRNLIGGGTASKPVPSTRKKKGQVLISVELMVDKEYADKLDKNFVKTLNGLTQYLLSMKGNFANFAKEYPDHSRYPGRAFVQRYVLGHPGTPVKVPQQLHG